MGNSGAPYIISALILAVAAPVTAQDDKMDWKGDYKAALKTAKEDGKLVIVHFWADW